MSRRGDDLYLRYLRSPYSKVGNGGVSALARDAGVHHNTVYALFAGQREPMPATVVRVSQALDRAEAEDERHD